MNKPSLSEADTRAKLMDPALHAAGWTEDLIRRETTLGGVDIFDGRPRRCKGRTGFLLRLPASPGADNTGLPSLIEGVNLASRGPDSVVR